MAKLDLQAWNSKWSSPEGLLKNNTTGAISEEILRQLAQDANDSFRDILDDGGPVEGQEGTIYHVHWSLPDLNAKTFTIPADFPDIGDDMPIHVSVGGHTQLKGFDYTTTARTLTILGNYDPIITQAGHIVQFVYDTGAGDGTGNGNAGPAFTISQGDQIVLEPGTEQVPGVPDIRISAAPEVVTNQTDAASGLAFPGTLTEVTNANGNDIKSTGVKIIGPARVPIPSSNTAAGIVGQYAVNETNGNYYRCYKPSKWLWVNAPTQAERITFNS